jgi:HK97 family phage prohead protease
MAALYAQEAMNQMEHKTFELVETKAVDDEKGSFQALASVFGNVDRGGDRVMPGAFANTLEKWRSSGRSFPIVWSHQHDDLHAYIGKADPRAIYEDERGLVIQGQLDMEDDTARKAWRLMMDGLITDWSFGYREVDAKQAKDGANEINEIELFEAGPTLVGMNPEARLEAIKKLEPEPHALDDVPEAIEAVSADEPTEAKAQTLDPLRNAHDRLVYELMTGEPSNKAKAQDSTLAELRRAHDALTLDILTGK